MDKRLSERPKACVDAEEISEELDVSTESKVYLSIFVAFQELENQLHNHSKQQKSQIESTAQSLINNHIMVAKVQTDLEEFQTRFESTEAKVRY